MHEFLFLRTDSGRYLALSLSLSLSLSLALSLSLSHMPFLLALGEPIPYIPVLI